MQDSFYSSQLSFVGYFLFLDKGVRNRSTGKLATCTLFYSNTIYINTESRLGLLPV
jgi:hypothetical protein